MVAPPRGSLAHRAIASGSATLAASALKEEGIDVRGIIADRGRRSTPESASERKDRIRREREEPSTKSIYEQRLDKARATTAGMKINNLTLPRITILDSTKPCLTVQDPTSLDLT